MKNEILKAMRIRIFAGEMIEQDRFQITNTGFKKPESGIWVRESFNGGNIEGYTNVSTRQIAIVNYEVFCRSGLGTLEADALIKRLVAEFPINGDKSGILTESGRKAEIYRIVPKDGGIDASDPNWYRQVISFIMRIYLPETSG